MSALLAVLAWSVGDAPVIEQIQQTSNPVEHADQPNIVFVLSDDQRVDTLGAMPHLQLLMEQATTFSHAYVTTPLCCPSRSSILSGQYAHNHGVLSNRTPYGFDAFEDQETLPKWLHDAGYRTALIGKYLNGYDRQDAKYVPPGWDVFRTFVGEPGYDEFGLTQHVDGVDGGVKEYVKSNNVYSTDLLGELAVDFLTDAATRPEQPFFLYFTPFAPHAPATPPARYANLHETFEQTPAFNEADVSDKTWLATSAELLRRDLNQIERTKTNMYASLRALDDTFQVLLDTLEVNGQLKNTVVIYMGDNGVHWGEHRIPNGKSTPYEESIHVPLVLYDGRVPRKHTDDRLVLNIDIAPTLLSYAGVEVPSSVDGRSWLNQDGKGWREIFLTESWGKGEEVPDYRQAHTDKWSFTEFATGGRELYDLGQDPYQLENIVDNPELASTVAELKTQLDAMTTCVGNICP